MTPISVVIPTVDALDHVRRVLESLRSQSVGAQVVLVDNGSSDGTVDAVSSEFPWVDVIRLERNEGFARAVNEGVRHADGEVVVVLNNDCHCDPQFLHEITRPIDPGRGVVMAAGVLYDARTGGVIDTAGLKIDATLLASDYLAGRPLSVLEQALDPPDGPSGGAAAFDLPALRSVGGFDERLFAYWEDVDLALRLRVAGGHCVLASRARAAHSRSSTLGEGSSSKSFHAGFGRGYVIAKWNVLSARRIATVLGRELAISGGQAILDRNLAGVRGRARGYREGRHSDRRPYPVELRLPTTRSGAQLVHRILRRRQIRAAGAR
jgi:GT2 family glycosyltransferase